MKRDSVVKDIIYRVWDSTFGELQSFLGEELGSSCRFERWFINIDAEYQDWDNMELIREAVEARRPR